MATWGVQFGFQTWVEFNKANKMLSNADTMAPRTNEVNRTIGNIKTIHYNDYKRMKPLDSWYGVTVTILKKDQITPTLTLSHQHPEYMHVYVSEAPSHTTIFGFMQKLLALKVWKLVVDTQHCKNTFTDGSPMIIGHLSLVTHAALHSTTLQ